MDIIEEFYFSDRLIKIDNYRLDNEPLSKITQLPSGPSLVLYCGLLCLQMEECQSVSILNNSTICKLYNVSLAMLGSIPISDNDWNTYVRGMHLMNSGTIR